MVNFANNTYTNRAKVDSALTTTVTGLKWFKIYQDGYDASTGKWAVDTLITNKGKVTFTLPSCIAAGQYLMRHEIIGWFPADFYAAIIRLNISFYSFACGIIIPRCPILCS